MGGTASLSAQEIADQASAHAIDETKPFFWLRFCNSRAEKLPSKDALGQSDPYLTCVWDRTREMKSYVVKSDCNPIWRGYEEVWRWVPQNIGVMDDLFFELEVWDADIFTSDDIIGVAAVDIHTLASGPVHHDVELIGEVGEPCGRLLFDLEVIQVSTIKATFYEVKAIGLQAPPPETTLDPYVEYHFSGDGNAGNYAQSTVCFQTLDPIWEEPIELDFSSDIKNLLSESIIIKVKNYQQIVAECIIPMTKYFCFDPRLRFSEPLFFQGKAAGSVEGWLSFDNLPFFGQMIGGVHCELGVSEAVPLMPGIPLPRMPANCQPFVPEDADELVLSMRSHAHFDFDFHLEAKMLALASVSMDVENRFVIFSEGGLQLIVKIMLEHPLQVGLLQHAIRCLGNLSLGNDINKLLIAHEKGVRAVVVTMHSHPRESSLLQQSCLLLRIIGESDDLKMIIAEEGGLAAVIEVLHNNPRDPALLEFACGCLAALCILVDNAVMCVNDKVLLPILDGMNKNPKEENFLREACFAIRNLALPTPNKMIIVQQGAIEALLLVLKAHDKSRDVAGAVVSALRELTINAESAIIVAQNNGAKYLLNTIRRHPDLREVVQEILCFVRIAWTIKYTCVSTKKEGVGIDPALVQKRDEFGNLVESKRDAMMKKTQTVGGPGAPGAAGTMGGGGTMGSLQQGGGSVASFGKTGAQGGSFAAGAQGGSFAAGTTGVSYQ